MTTGTKTPDAPTPTPTATERLREQAHTVGEDLRTLGGVAKEAADEKLTEARRAAREVYLESRQRAEGELDRFSAHVRENPLQSIAIAAGIGALIGLLLRRRN
jgi:ElaB/YqjD/DUF883 family membrane-anchored ribosome-binding protein